MDTIKQLTCKTLFNIYQKDYPKIVEFIKAGLANGETPRSIYKFMQTKLGKNSSTANHVSLIAEHLKANP